MVVRYIPQSFDFISTKEKSEKRAAKKNPKKSKKRRIKFAGLDFPKKLASIVSFYIFAT